MNTTADSTSDNTSRPFGFWLKAVDRLMAQDFATAFAAEGATRRDWRLLNVVDGSVPARRPLTPHKLHDLIDRGWVEADGDGWALTDEGRAAKERLGAAVDGLRAKVAGAVSDEEMATTLAALEKIARAFGWDEETPLPRKQRPGFGFGPRRGFGPGRGHGRGRGFAPGEGFEPRYGFDRHDCHENGGHRGRGHHDGHDHRDHGHAHRGHGHRAQRMAERAFERGFDAGFRHGHAA
ncbi:MarR family winged helix-turn-helix transcriptional regulator [Microbacterium sp. LCT-H2]|uniref:MarR family winged helix-turn-helix transcriptional regulator n=1 Tax=Microbacterium sp. LCT-H2 TaxID=1914306 RepID=UPI0008F54E6B|nr:hypothetical protein [Microbacterium sp. LCT-H2]OIJ32430.1 hypothetical protein BK819_11780 [Microbacterium sp. LCT-H2]